MSHSSRTAGAVRRETGITAMNAMPLPRQPLPPMARVRQALPADHVANVRTEVCARLLASPALHRVAAGNRIAITAGSRGIGGFVELLAGIVDAVRSRGAEPFIIPAMGSHGGATGEGQTKLL